MQEPIFKLNEIVWEITGRCQNRCSYCGSKDVWNEQIDEQRIINIAEEIAKYPPRKIDISGGDPTLVPSHIHRVIYGILKKKNIYCKILINPESIENRESDVFEILDVYDYFGLSINTKDDLNIAKKHNIMSNYKNKFTVITNFNTDNIFIFNDICDYVGENHCSTKTPLMIQYTVYRDEEDPRAIYNNEQAFEYFKQKIIECGYPNIIFSDNLSNGPCGVGRSTIGILSDGTVIPCLSMRSWIDDIKKVSQGNVLDTPLENIWKNKFNDFRFECFKCCKDHCKNKAIGEYISKLCEMLGRLESKERKEI